MYARVTTYNIDPSKLGEMPAVLSELKARILALPGIKVSNTVWREDGRGITMSIYDCRASAEEAAPALTAIWNQFSNVLAEQPVTELYDRTENLLGR